MIAYLARAIADVEQIANSIARDVHATFARLHDSPKIGRPRRFRRRDLREVRSWPVVGFQNHLIFFISADDGTLVVLRVLHGARQNRSALFKPGA